MFRLYFFQFTYLHVGCIFHGTPSWKRFGLSVNEIYFSRLPPGLRIVLHVWEGKVRFQAPPYVTTPEQAVWLTHVTECYVYVLVNCETLPLS